MKIETLQQAEQFIVFENDFKIVVKESKDAADWISQRELDKGGTGGATYGPYKSNGVLYYEIYKDGATESDVIIPNIVIRN